ncbi:hypothetical protein CC80DRAFT_3518 [Byssothecium circinans]|uniref:Uncharacterized protein n=1 Tax=Byssothecium circinans TaxID=147558 RepID=A0A6A5UDR4_9PLEO|nr:hypothetical protein CC80DRAFT_3518 [Byssothecium circinans]
MKRSASFWTGSELRAPSISFVFLPNQTPKYSNGTQTVKLIATSNSIPPVSFPLTIFSLFFFPLITSSQPDH